MDATQILGLQLRAVSVRGALHRLNATVRQDSFALGVSGDGLWLVAAVCDGLGSVPLSHLGSAAAAQAATAKLCELLATSRDHQECVNQAVIAAVEGIRTAAGDRHRPEELATTISLVAVRRTSDGTHSYISGTVGDSPIMTLDPVGGLRTLGSSSTAGLHETATSNIPRDHTKLEFADGSISPGASLLVATDGFAIPAMLPPTNGHLVSAWASPPGILEFMQDVQFQARSFDDDRTVVGIWSENASPTTRP